ncbi:MAG TPA: fatty acid desaturase [Verrucomicrobiae bacterium]|jgi:omega-6 fatty acid desaturase (delta-12 desaturase)
MTVPDTLYARTKAYAHDRSWKSWWYILSTMFLLAAAVAGTFPILPLPYRIFSSVLSGLLMVRLFVIYHDQQHRAMLPKSRPAAILMRFLGMILLSPNAVWRSSHDYHHSHNCKLRSANIGSFPIMTLEQYRQTSTGQRLLYLFMRHPLTILFGYITVFIFGMVILPFFNAPRKNIDCLPTFLLHVGLAVWLGVHFGWLAPVLTMFVPFLIASAIGAYLFYAQHNFPGVLLKDKQGWTYEGAALDSSSFLKMGPLMTWFTANIGYHHIHHLNHRIPFYRLPEIYRDVPELRRARTTSLHPLEIFRCLRLKVWCVKSQRMVSLKGV